MKHTISKGLALKCLVAGAALGLSSAASAVPSMYFQSNNCPGICTDFASSGLTGVSGGAVIDPATTINGEYKRPGDDTGNGPTNVTSYNVTSSLAKPDSTALTPIIITGLMGGFDMYWGSIDSYNIIDFLYQGSNAGQITGTDAQALAAGSDGTPQQFNVDGYFYFEGKFDEVRLSSTNGVAFEVARVPEPGTLALLGLGLAGLGAARRRMKA